MSLACTVLCVWMAHLHRFIPCPKCSKEIPDHLVCGGYRNIMNAGLQYQHCSCGWFEWLLPCRAAYPRTCSPPPKDEFPIEASSLPMLDPSLELHGANLDDPLPMLNPSLELHGTDLDFEYDPAWFHGITPLTPPLLPTPMLPPAITPPVMPTLPLPAPAP
ncbi:hypothetical protein L208DRAFT_1383020 [Tricholoma matsutake]|nr:hypothetical protein L208DRAFT_1383020 [Tricholoma matsutake 945]